MAGETIEYPECALPLPDIDYGGKLDALTVRTKMDTCEV